MTTVNQLQCDIERSMKSLSLQALKEVKLFIDFLHVREGDAPMSYHSDIDYELHRLDLNEAEHLEKEFIAYQDRYPCEN